AEVDDAEHDQQQQREQQRELDRDRAAVACVAMGWPPGHRELPLCSGLGAGAIRPPRPMPSRCRQRAADMVANAVLICVPSVATMPTITAAISATSKPYSTAVAPRSSRWRAEDRYSCRDTMTFIIAGSFGRVGER